MMPNPMDHHTQPTLPSSSQHKYNNNNDVHVNQNHMLTRHSSFQTSSQNNLFEHTEGAKYTYTIQHYQPISTDQILNLAAHQFLQFSSQNFTNINISLPPHASSLTHHPLPFEDKQHLELAHLLLTAADNVAHHQFDTGITLLHACQSITSNHGTPLQRLVFYFTQALMERITKHTATSEKKEEHVDACLKRNVPAFVAMHQQLPFFQVLYFTAIQTILEHLRTKSKLHLIDFQVLTGIHLPALMQAVAQREINPGAYLKITVIETSDKPGSEKTGKLLNSFATYLNIPFTYKLVFLADIKDLREEELDINPEEAFMLRALISKPIFLKNLMNIMQKIRPSVMVVAEVEGNHNSPSFVNCFIEALFFYGALFDSLDESMSREDKNRMVIETGVLWEGIRNIVSTEGRGMKEQPEV